MRAVPRSSLVTSPPPGSSSSAAVQEQEALQSPTLIKQEEPLQAQVSSRPNLVASQQQEQVLQACRSKLPSLTLVARAAAARAPQERQEREATARPAQVAAGAVPASLERPEATAVQDSS